MKNSFISEAGQIELTGTIEFHNPDFGYTLFEDVVDPENPEGPRAIAMHLPARSLSKVWQLVEHGYSERIELLDGSCSLVVNRFGTEDWTTMPLDAKNPTADGIVIECGDMFCIVTDDTEATVLSRPSKPFDISFEKGVTKHPNDKLSRFILAHVSSLD